MRVAVYPQPHQHLLLFIIFLIVLILTGVRWYLIVLLDLRFPYKQWCWATFHVSGGLLYVFFGKMSIKVLCSFFFSDCYWCLVVWDICIFWIVSSYQIYACKYLLFRRLLFLFLIVSFSEQKFFCFVVIF